MKRLDKIVIKPTSDYFIATLLTSEGTKDILLSLINAVLVDAGHPKIVIAEVLNPFNVKEYEDGKGIVIDVRAKDENGRVFHWWPTIIDNPVFRTEAQRTRRKGDFFVFSLCPRASVRNNLSRKIKT